MERNELFGVIVLTLGVGTIIGILTGSVIGPAVVQMINQQIPRIEAKEVRQYTLIIDKATRQYGDASWEAWTYNGTVPGPTLRGKVGETLRIRVINHLDLVHSLHTHLAPYPLEYDGSQANIIANVGAGL